MADKKISELTAASTLDGTEALPVVQGGSTKKATTAQQRDLTASYVGARVLAISGTPSSLTGTLTETALATITIPAGAMGANGRIEVWAQFTASPSSANAKTGRVRFGGLAGTNFQTATMTTTLGFQANVYVQNMNAQNVQEGFSLQTTAFAPTAAAVDTSASTTFVLTGQLANAGDTITLRSYRVLLFPKA
jgi:hypothetical protein